VHSPALAFSLAPPAYPPDAPGHACSHAPNTVPTLTCLCVGGEKRRCSVAHELLIDPSLLLLDEPTSGLDSTSAMRMFRTMQALARSGRTVIASVHQPSSRGFQLLDKVQRRGFFLCLEGLLPSGCNEWK
jgi:ABC-type ATPase involved in cell division